MFRHDLHPAAAGMCEIVLALPLWAGMAGINWLISGNPVAQPPIVWCLQILLVAVGTFYAAALGAIIWQTRGYLVATTEQRLLYGILAAFAMTVALLAVSHGILIPLLVPIVAAAGERLSSYYFQPTRSTVVEIESAYAHKVVCPDMGGIIVSIV